ncbi:protein FAR-RED ELONGATED HYPOCOTYL 3-like [Hibiscus syriacus]|uniref:protein FAR-RED ELONGATED HYPOCOTYL 3-like n=1 Tax=Hibiscus syriacus TaxID=106335 RepID=UPI00192049A5|nr:protein FAR-RED ELONGATED HYPOCOTYL 3-like [Hibiscus syriacus]
MDIDLRLPSGEQCTEDEDANGIDNMLDGDETLQNGMVQVVGEDMRADDGAGEMHSSAVDMVTFKEDNNLEPLSGMEFE